MPVEFRADLHIHTCLSPCADIGMTPLRIIEKAASLGLNIIAISDHNSVENAEVARRLGMKKGINAIPGMEITSSEEVHVLGLFRYIEDAWKMQNIVYENLQPGENDENAFGMQVVVNEEEEVLGFNRRLLIGATRLSVNNLVEAIHSFNGIAIAAHIDREGFGIISQLGFIPSDLKLDALEISSRVPIKEAESRFKEYSHIPWIVSSDAHSLNDIGKACTGFFMEHSTFEELRLALKGTGGRKISC